MRGLHRNGSGAEPHRSLWLQEALGDAPDAEPLVGAQRADVAIVGGGFVGLWTALRIKEHEPDCDVVVLEQDVCGYGASGRNGGFAIGWWPKLGTLVALAGEEEGIRLARAADEAVEEIGRWTEANGVDANYVHGGHLWTAATPAQLGAWDGAVGRRGAARRGRRVRAPGARGGRAAHRLADASRGRLGAGRRRPSSRRCWCAACGAWRWSAAFGCTSTRASPTSTGARPPSCARSRAS